LAQQIHLKSKSAIGRPGALIQINGHRSPANDWVAISWARSRAELIFIKTSRAHAADKWGCKENSHA
jgi:hypothetical protein